MTHPLADSSTSGAEKRAPPAEGSRPMIAGISPMTTRLSPSRPCNELTRDASVPVVRRMYSSTMMSAKATTSETVVGSMEARSAVSARARGPMPMSTPRTAAATSMTNPRFQRRRNRPTTRANTATILTSSSKRAASELHVEAVVHDVSVGDDVVLAFDPQRPVVAADLDGAGLEQSVVAHDFGSDESALDV